MLRTARFSQGCRLSAVTVLAWLGALGGLGGRVLALGNLRRVLGPRWRIDPLPPLTRSAGEARGGGCGGVPASVRVSVCVPARDEGRVIDRLLSSLDGQDLDGMDVVVVDDRSADDTAARAATHRATVLPGTAPPEGWLGKCWALHQAAGAVRGELLFFVDADTWHHPAAMRTVAVEMERDRLDVMVVIGGQHLGSWAERIVQPFFWTLLLSLLNPERAEDPAFPNDAMGNGQFACYRRGPYLSAGGHEGVRDRIVEDVALARGVKGRGGKYRFRMGPRLTCTRMYDGLGALWAGFRKNAAVVDPARPGLSIGLTTAAALLIMQAELWPWGVMAAYALPWLDGIAVLDGPWLGVAALAQLLAIFAGRFLLYREVCDEASGARLSRHPLCYALQPVGAVIGLAAMFASLASQLRGTVEWKGRTVKARSL